MARNAKKSARKNNKNTNLSIVETLETRSMMSATPTVVGYLPDYQTTPALTALLKSDHFSGMTQLNYFSVLPDTNGVLPGTTANGHTNASTVSSSEYDINSLLDPVVTDAHAAGVKVNIVVGGAGKDSASLSSVVRAGSSAWSNLASSIQSFVTTHHLDGVDIDWEPAGLTATDISNYSQMLQTIKGTTQTAGLKLSVAVGAEKVWLAPNYVAPAYILNAAAIAAVDSINVMDYDLVNPGAGAPSDLAKQDMQNWVSDAGAPASKLIMGLPFYGRATTLTDAEMSSDDPWANATDYNSDAAGYGAIVKAVHGNMPTDTSFTPNLSVSAYIPNSFKGQEPYVVWHFDGRGTIADKTSFALNNHFGGVMIWSLGMDSYDVTATNAQGAPTAEQYNAYSLTPVVQQTVAAYNASNATTTPAQLSGAPIGTAGTQGNGIANVFDGKLNTFYDATTAGTAANPDWVGLDLGSAKSLTQIKFAARSGLEYRMEGGVFQGSNTANFTSNVNLYTIGNIVAPSSTSLTAVNASGTFRYVRFLAPAGAYGNIAEMQVFGTTPAAARNRALAAIFSTSTIHSNDKQI